MKNILICLFFVKKLALLINYFDEKSNFISCKCLFVLFFNSKIGRLKNIYDRLHLWFYYLPNDTKMIIIGSKINDKMG